MANLKGEAMDMRFLHKVCLFSWSFFLTVLLLLFAGMLEAQGSKDPVSLSPTGLSFGSQTVGSSATQTVKLTNNQKTTLTISSVLAGADFQVAPTSTCTPNLSVGAGKSCNIDVR